MKKLILISATLVLLVACKTKKESIGVVAEPKSTYLPAGPQIAAAEKRWPGTTATDLQTGNSIYTTKCTRCHGNFEVTQFSERKWLHEIDDMSVKANLSQDEKDKLTRYILSLRDTRTVSTQ